ncbi:MAG: hypothetical protein FDZ75_09030 [Actinobacteria bacterium]|nr:MAG: hypothetical protein FDZ75_09030 [Actinomycetota bacterium]
MKSSLRSAAYPADLYDKVAKARGIHGLRYIHMNLPCPSGWAFDPKDSVRLGEMAVDAGLTVLYEIEAGEFRLTGRSKTLAKQGRKVAIAEYVATQGRFRGITAEDVAAIQAWTDERWERFVTRDAGECG